MTSDLVARQPMKEKRRANKPLLERKRRARINDSLTDLKHLVLSSLNKDVTKYTKMEKVDILDMTVQFLKRLDERQGNYSSVYRAGYQECTKEMYQNIMTMDGLDHSLKCRILSNLANTQKEDKISPPPSPTISNEPLSPIPSPSASPTKSCISSIFDPTTGQCVNTSHLFPPSVPHSVVSPGHPLREQQYTRTDVISYDKSAQSVRHCHSKPHLTCIGVPTVQHTSQQRLMSFETNLRKIETLWRPW